MTRDRIISRLSECKHFIKYPRMTPWVGSKYLVGSRLLIIGESHYLPSGVTYHHDSERWYEGEEQELQEDISRNCMGDVEKKKGINYINTSGILRIRSSDSSIEKRKKFSAKGHAIYRNVFSSMNSACIGSANYLDAVDHVAYYNYFQRPAEYTGGSIRVTKRDKEVAEVTFKHVLHTLKPDLIIVVSSKVGQVIKPHLEGYKYAVTAHPACPWWTRKTKKGTNAQSTFKNFLRLNY